MKAMILAAGFGKRLLPVTESIPKPLLKIGNETLIQRNIKLLIESGYSEIIINVSHLGHLIKEHVEETFPGKDISFSFEEKPLGTGGGILKALPLLGDECFLVINADIFHNIKLTGLLNNVEAAHLIGVPNPNHNIDGDFNIRNNLVTVGSNSNNLTWSGLSIINPVIFKDNSFKTNSFNMWNAVLSKYINKNLVTGEISSELWLDVGTPERLKLANSVYNDEN